MIHFCGALRGDMVEVGRIVKPQGIRGELKIVPFSPPVDDPLAGITPGSTIFVRGAAWQPFKVVALRSSASALYVGLEHVDDRNGAEELRDRTVALPASALPSLPEGEYYWHNLEGLPALLEGGDELGRVRSYLLTGAHPLLIIVDSQRREYMVPAHCEFFSVVTDPAGAPVALRLTPPPGLLEL